MRSLARLSLLLALCASNSAFAAGGSAAAAPGSARSTRSVSAAAPAAASPAPAPLVTTPPDQSQPPEESPPEAAEPPTLESRIPPVSARAFSTARKLELTVGIGFSLNDAFVEKFIPELTVGYHFNDNFFLGLRGGYALDTDAGHVNACSGPQPGATCGAPTAAQLAKLPGNFTGLGVVEFAWTPVYGKVNLFGEKVLHFDFSLLADAGVLVLGAQPDPTASSISPEFSPGIGQRFFISSSVAISAEFRDLLYSSAGLQNQLVFHLGLTFLL